MRNILSGRSVFVLGAGATRAFLPGSPLMEDDYGLERLLNIFSGHPYAFEILQQEKYRNQKKGFINIERLMTRLLGRMPYDLGEKISHELSLLFTELKDEFIRRVEVAKKDLSNKDELAAFARLCVKKRINCITFNYDDVLDQALWEVEKFYRGRAQDEKQMPYWHPDGGYGFFVRPSEVTIRDGDRFMDKTSMLLLKLHGSINWFARMGERRPYSVDAVLHHQNWYPPSDQGPSGYDPELIGRHLVPDPFLIPPVLDKSALVEEPVLSLVWSLAKEILKNSHEVVFVGYSMPVTDLAASFLFSEALGERAHIVRAVNLADKEEDRERVRSAYRKVFPKMRDDQFDFEGALKWVRETIRSAQE